MKSVKVKKGAEKGFILILWGVQCNLLFIYSVSLMSIFSKFFFVKTDG